MKYIFACMFVLFAVVAVCTGEGSDPGEILIRKIYTDHQPNKRLSILDTKETLSKYFDKEMTDLFIKDQDCSVKSGEVCNLDYDPIYNSQEFSDSDIKLKIKKQASSKTSETFEVTFDNFGPVKLIYQVRKTDAGWRVTDIVDGEGNSLKKSLAAKIE